MSKMAVRELTAQEYLEIRDSPEFGQVKKAFRGFAFPITAVFLGWYMAFVLLSVYARDFMSLPLWGESFNVGHFMGLLQFLSTFVITALYLHHSRRNVDPKIQIIRDKLKADAS